MSFSIRPARDDDVVAIATISTEAFAPSTNHRTMFPPHRRVKPGLEDALEWTIKRTTHGLGDPAARHILAVKRGEDGNEIIAGCAEWVAPRTEEPKPKVEGPVKTEEEKKAELEEKIKKLPPYLDYEAAQEGGRQVEALIEATMPAFEGRSLDKMWSEFAFFHPISPLKMEKLTYVALNSISVVPQYRGQGIGKALTRWGLEEADKKGEDVWLISAPEGRKLYLSLGFKEIGEGMRFDEAQYIMTKLYEPKQ